MSSSAPVTSGRAIQKLSSRWPRSSRSLAAVTVTLGLGLYSLFRGGAYARSHSNRLMRWRVGLQALAVLLLVIGMLWKATAS